MNIVFFGTSEFAIPALRALLGSRHKVMALVAQPDRKKGRRLKLSPPPTKVLALAKGASIYQPQDVSSGESIEYLKKIGADLFVVIAFGQILKKEVLAIPRVFSINLHASLLPKYRGAAPTNWAIINGDQTTGFTAIRMNEKMDAGDIILKKEVVIEEGDTNITLNEKLSELGADILLKAIELIEAGKARFEKQDDLTATYAPKLKKADGLIDWNEPAKDIHNKVRGFVPWPGAYTHYEGKALRILQTELSNKLYSKDAAAGEVVDIIKNKGIVAHTGSGDLIIRHLQLEGKKILDADSFLRGHRIPKGHVFGS